MIELKPQITNLIKEFYRTPLQFHYLLKDWIRLKEDFPEKCAKKEDLYFALIKLEDDILDRLIILDYDFDANYVKNEYIETYQGKPSLETLLESYLKLLKIFNMIKFR